MWRERMEGGWRWFGGGLEGFLGSWRGDQEEKDSEDRSKKNDV